MTTGTMQYQQHVRVFTVSGTWTKPERLVHVRLILAGAGGGGHTLSPGGGGGGGAAVQSKWIAASELPETVDVLVGQSAIGAAGGTSAFLDYRAPGGQPGTAAAGGAGGIAPWRGGAGGAPGQWGETVSLLPIHLLAGGGGGAGSGDTWGGASGMNIREDGSTTSAAPLFAAGVLQCGHGGSRDNNQSPQWPAGGGGVMQAGAAGVVTVIETTFVLEG